MTDRDVLAAFSVSDVRKLLSRLEAAEADARQKEEALRKAAESFDVIRRCVVNSREAPNVFDTIHDVALWNRDDALAALGRA